MPKVITAVRRHKPINNRRLGDRIERITDIQPVEIKGQHWISVCANSREIRRHGPFPSADAAEAMAAKLLAVWRALQVQT